MASKQLEGFAQSLSGLGALGKVAAVGVAGVAAAGAGLVAGLVGSIGEAMNFEAAMSAVAAVAGASDGELKALSDTALKLGQDTTLSGIGATDAARAMRELAAAGMSATDIINGGALGALRLASAGGIDVARAAEIAALALSQFGLAGTDAAMVADLFAGAANASAISVDDIAETMKYVGPVASAMGLSIQEVTATVAALGNQGIKSSAAGTALRGMIVNLAKPSKEATKVMTNLGLSFFDGAGKMKDLAGISEELKTKLSGLTDKQRASALATLFGNEGLTAATILYGEGADGINEWIKKLDEGSTAEEVGKKRNDNLKGSIEALKSSFETAQIVLGKAFLPALKGVVDQMALGVSAAIPLIEAWGPKLAAGIGAGLTQAVAIVQTFGAAFLAVFRGIFSGDFNSAFGPILNAIQTAFGPDAMGPVTLFVSHLLTALQTARDAVITAKQAFSGEWVSSDTIATPVRIVGEAFTLLGDGVRAVQGFLAGLPAPVLAVAAGFIALGPALRIAAVALPLLIGAFTGLGPIISFLTSTLPLLGSVIAALGWPITAVVVAVGLLAAAWATNFMGIQTATMPILQQIGDFITGTFLPAVGQLGTYLMTNVVPLFVQGWAMIQQGVTVALAAIMPYVQQFIGFLTGQLLPGIQGIIAVAVPAFQQFAAGAMGAFQAALPGIQSFINGVMALGAAVLPIVMQVAGVIMDSLGPAVMAVVTWAQTMIPQLGAAWENVWGIIGPVVGTIADFIGSTLSAIAGFISSHSDTIVSVLTGAWNIIKGVVEIAWSLISGIISTGLQVLSGNWTGAWETIKQTASNVWDGIKTVISGAWQAITGILTLALDAAKSLLSGAWDAITSTATSGWEGVKTVISTALEAMKTAVTNGIASVVTLMEGLPGKAKAAIGDLSGLLVGAGKALVQGLLDGMGSLLGAVRDKAAELANAAADAIKGALRINSPSKVMIEYGAGIGEGLMVGMTERQAETVAVAQAIGLDVAEGMLSGLSSQSGKLGGWLRTIEDAMKGMGGGTSRLASAKDFLTGALQRNSAATLEATLAAVEAYRMGLTNTEGLANAANGIASNVASATGAIASGMGGEGTSNANAFASSSSAVVAAIKKGIDAFPALDSIKDIPAKVLGDLFKALEGALEYAGQLVDRSDALKEAALEFLANMTAAAAAYQKGNGMAIGGPALAPSGVGGGSGGQFIKNSGGGGNVTLNMYGDNYDTASFQDRVIDTLEQADRQGRRP